MYKNKPLLFECYHGAHIRWLLLQYLQDSWRIRVSVCKCILVYISVYGLTCMYMYLFVFIYANVLLLVRLLRYCNLLWIYEKRRSIWPLTVSTHHWAFKKLHFIGQTVETRPPISSDSAVHNYLTISTEHYLLRIILNAVENVKIFKKKIQY